MVKLWLMASQGHLPGFVLPHEQGSSRLSQDCQPLWLSLESRQELIRPGFLAMRPLSPHQSEQPWKPTIRLLDNNHFVSTDSTIRRPELIDAQDTCPNSVLFSFGITNQCTKQEEILEFLSSRSCEVERHGLELSVLTDLMGLQVITTETSHQPYVSNYEIYFNNANSQPSLYYPNINLYPEKPPLDLVGDLAHKSEIMGQLDGEIAFASAQSDMKDILAIIAEFYLSKSSTKWRKQSLLVPQFERHEVSEARVGIHGSLKLEPIGVVPLKSPRKTRLRSSPKKKTSGKAGKERELHRRNYSRSCESLLSIIVDKKRHRKTAILELKKSGPELTQLLTKFSASIAGTGLALLLSVVCKVASGRVPFCASKLLNAGLGIGLVWLSSSVNQLRDTIINISKNSGKWDLKEEEMMKNLDRSVKEISFRAVTLMAIMMLRFA